MKLINFGKWLLLLGGVFLISGCGDGEKVILVKNSQVSEVCDLMEVECSKTQEKTESVVFNEDRTAMKVSLPVTSCRDISLHSVKEEAGKLKVNLIEEGLSCSEGGLFSEVLIRFEHKVKIEPENVEVIKLVKAQEKEETDEDNEEYFQVYP